MVDQLFGSAESSGEDVYRCDDKHYTSLLSLIAGHLKIAPKQIVDFELNVIDTQPAGLVGLHKEFVSAPRLDNLGSTLVALDAIIASPPSADNAEVNMIMLFDHEEVGS